MRFIFLSVTVSVILFSINAIAQPTGEENKTDSAAARVMIYHVSDTVDFEYLKPKQLAWITNMYPTTKEYFKTTLVKKNLIPIGGMITATAVLCLWDKAIIDGAQKIGDNLGIAHTNRQKTYGRFSIKLGENKFEVPLNGPWDLNSAMYYLGDGVTHLTIAGSFWAYGAIAKDFRARHTAGQLAESIIACGIVV